MPLRPSATSRHDRGRRDGERLPAVVTAADDRSHVAGGRPSTAPLGNRPLTMAGGLPLKSEPILGPRRRGRRRSEPEFACVGIEPGAGHPLDFEQLFADSRGA